MTPSEFSQIARDCALVLQCVLVGDVKTPEQLESAWPRDAEEFAVLDRVRDDIFEYWLLEPGVEYRSVILAGIRVLQSASDDPDETLARLEREIDES